MCKPGWSYFSGFCYSTSQTCKNWTEAQKTCQIYNTSLITVKNQEENVYIQHRLNGDKGWIGFNDRDTEGTFVWAGNQSSNFTYWAPHQPNDFKLNEDCVHTLGVAHKFTWNDVNCRSCHNYTCFDGKCNFLYICKPYPFNHNRLRPKEYLVLRTSGITGIWIQKSYSVPLSLRSSYSPYFRLWLVSFRLLACLLIYFFFNVVSVFPLVVFSVKFFSLFTVRPWWMQRKQSWMQPEWDLYKYSWIIQLPLWQWV